MHMYLETRIKTNNQMGGFPPAPATRQVSNCPDTSPTWRTPPVRVSGTSGVGALQQVSKEDIP